VSYQRLPPALVSTVALSRATAPECWLTAQQDAGRIDVYCGLTGIQTLSAARRLAMRVDDQLVPARLATVYRPAPYRLTTQKFKTGLLR
jgi:hypothetical protein